MELLIKKKRESAFDLHFDEREGLLMEALGAGLGRFQGEETEWSKTQRCRRQARSSMGTIHQGLRRVGWGSVTVTGIGVGGRVSRDSCLGKCIPSAELPPWQRR